MPLKPYGPLTQSIITYHEPFDPYAFELGGGGETMTSYLLVNHALHSHEKKLLYH